jgi:hypothetical protein
MEFEFDKFVKDIENRKNKSIEENKESQSVIYHDQQRRLRAERYHERWQNRIVWSDS